LSYDLQQDQAANGFGWEKNSVRERAFERKQVFGDFEMSCD
jgi:hypothetical protein